MTLLICRKVTWSSCRSLGQNTDIFPHQFPIGVIVAPKEALATQHWIPLNPVNFSLSVKEKKKHITYAKFQLYTSGYMGMYVFNFMDRKSFPAGIRNPTIYHLCSFTGYILARSWTQQRAETQIQVLDRRFRHLKSILTTRPNVCH